MEQVEPRGGGGGGSWDRDGETERNKENTRSLRVCEVPRVSLCAVFVHQFQEPSVFTISPPTWRVCEKR